MKLNFNLIIKIIRTADLNIINFLILYADSGVFSNKQIQSNDARKPNTNSFD